MKKIYSLLSIALIVTASFGQNKNSEKADNLFESYQYVDAIDAYLILIKNNKADAHVYKQLADSYYNVFNIEEATKWYAKAVQTDQDAETYFKYAQTLKSQGKYKEANKQMDVFAQKMPNDIRAKNHLKNPNYIPQLTDKSEFFEVEETTISDSEGSDFGAILTNDNILYFVSTRSNGKKEDYWTNQSYLDIYKSVRNEDGSLTEPEAVKSLNTPYHDGPITLSADGKTMYFSRDGHSEGSYKKLKNNKAKLAQQGLYKANLVNGKWENIQALPFNSINYSVSHPSLSSDGKTLFFTSNMPGGLGDTDIWKVSISSNSYSKPENLGARVNTSGKEGFPFISDNNILYFASSGKQGFGGLDIFKVELNNNEDAINLGNAVNTNRDDFAFSINTLKEIGYFSSNRSGVDNIYLAIPICHVEIIVSVKDAKTNALISGAKVVIKDSQNNPITEQSSNSKGNTSFHVSCEPDYYITISKDGYDALTIPVTGTKKDALAVNASLNPINEMITETEVKLNNIYFEFNKSNITQQGAFELDKLVTIMNDYPDMKILVRSHTDSQGSPEYNLKLSERRAQSTVQYLISKGINKDRLSAEGIGSADPKVACKANCTEEEDAQNRRSEFLIIK
ncbi:OmpA family protein [Bizionia arctica]|uniref:Cell envelope biogenesis protein OmpA n=1 Tax=Bizionia arctica TaxID=1495645 RepID=A0A917GD25_9FLAO|nr:OmpA family protein [Bizionia arctica]GGG39691.1 cell envelope biogenesis protein OmpA [Bizionia arctica]